MDETRVENLNLGHATAYGYAKSKGYTGTEEEFAQLCADLGIEVGHLEDMTVVVTMLEPEEDPSASYSEGTLTLNIPRGNKGDTGESAYEYAVAGGYTGTEEEFQQLCADLGIQVDHLENMTVVVNMIDPSVQPSATYVDGTLTINVQSATDAQVVTATDAWLAENISQETGYALDRSLSSSEAAAPADLVGDLKSAFTNAEKTTFTCPVTYTNLEKASEWTVGTGVDPSDGTNKSSAKQCKSAYIPFTSNTLFYLNSNAYEFIVWEYTSASVSSAVFSPKNEFSDDPVIIRVEQGAKNFRVGVRRKDDADMASADATAIAAAIKTFKLTDDLLATMDIPADAASVGAFKASLYSDNLFNVSQWENGAINATNGDLVGHGSRIRTKGYLPWNATRLHSTTSKAFMLYAWDANGTYVGGWKNGAFTNDASGYYEIDLTELYRNPAYNGYQYKVVIYTAQVDTISGVLIDNWEYENVWKKGINLPVTYSTILPSGTDFDTLTTLGNYLVENYSQISSHTNTPPGVATGGRLFVYADISNSRPVQVWVSYNGADEPEIWIRHYTSSWKKWVKVNQTNSVNLTVLGYNIGVFNWGQDGGLSTNVDTKIANYKKFFGKVNPDIMLFAEMSTYIDSGESYASDSTLLSPLFRTRVNFHQNAADTNLINAKKLENDGGIYLRNNNSEYAGAVGRLVCDINNKKLIMSGGFLRVLSTAQDRLEAFQNYLTAIDSYDYSIIYLDTNVGDNTERESIYNAATTAGYTVCNGGYFGLTNTLVPTEAYKPIDNIFVKGNIKVKNFYVATDEYDNLSSDHIPVVAELTLY